MYMFCVQDILQSAADHEPEYVSLKRDANTLCGGPDNEQELLDAHSKLRESSAEYVSKELDVITKAHVANEEVQGSSLGKPNSTWPRPGQVELEEMLSDYDRRLEELKNKLQACLSQRESQLEGARECENLLEGMSSWLEGGVAKLDELRLRDPKCAVIETQQQKCQV